MVMTARIPVVLIKESSWVVEQKTVCKQFQLDFPAIQLFEQFEVHHPIHGQGGNAMSSRVEGWTVLG